MSMLPVSEVRGRKASWRWALCLCLWWLAAFLPLSATAQYTNPRTALHDYVQAPDPAYSYALVTSVPQGDLTVHLLTLTSQQWRLATEIDRPLWQHWMAVLVPSQVRSTTGGLIIGGGRNSAQPPNLASTEIAIGAQLARAAGTVVAVLGQAPNQPLTPADVGTPLTEDALVAYTWRKAMDTGDWSWPAYLPMVKGAVRAMDAAQSFTPGVSPGTVLERFVVVGFSKRGAATWLTGAVDPRVVAMAPGVFDALNLAPQFEHHFASLGLYSPAIVDYQNNGIPRRARAPEAHDLWQVVDPYSYRRAVTMPKFLIHSSGDQFFMPDSGRFYQPELEGETLLRHVPNTDHSLSSSAGIADVLGSLTAWYQQVVADAPRPRIISQMAVGRLVVRSSLPAASAMLWESTNATARDFRRMTTAESWQATPLKDEGDGTQSAFSVSLAAPAQGYTARFVELTFPGVAGRIQTYSTRIHVAPDKTPFEVTDPIGKPRDRRFWARQFDIAMGEPGNADVDTATLLRYLPIPLFGDHVTTLQAARQILRGGPGAEAQARQQCLATRLNIARGELGWYSPVRSLGAYRWPLWWHYRQADRTFERGLARVAASVCEHLNAARAPAGQAVPAQEALAH
ncbi:MAG TPA: PhoPQ-activated protein PqaA family protein [Burkholderiaceae bacterium]|nr:PhoPQ-activated protein PqaA family protein [Burkholderiaceae bacterium]